MDLMDLQDALALVSGQRLGVLVTLRRDDLHGRPARGSGQRQLPRR